MTVNDSTPPDASTQPREYLAPVMARRTYMALRLASVGVIAVLGIAIGIEYHDAGNCLQGSISAYYYTPVQSVFVGALVTLGFVMIVLWGKTWVEDGALNLAGLFAPVVAFVPTSDTNLCGLETSSGKEVTTDGQRDAIVTASHHATDNNMLAYIIVVGIVIGGLFAVGIAAQAWTKWAFVVEHPWKFWLPWFLAFALWLVGTLKFAKSRDWFYDNAHERSAITMFIFIVIVVFGIAWQKERGKEELEVQRSRPWALTYLGLGCAMVIGAVVIHFAGGSDGFEKHRTFILEAWMISWLAVFWLLQTFDRAREGAPPKTDAERKFRALV